uniref:Uncharacterized protein n=1 Tax=Gouania willdenowi TaxID=441366 RepID=A0A8C5DD45_GOUWI
MDVHNKWTDLPKAPSLKNLTEGRFGELKDRQHAAVQDLTKAHIQSFDQAVTDGLSPVVQQRFWPWQRLCCTENNTICTV